MNVEMVLQIAGAWVILSCAALRLNVLRPTTPLTGANLKWMLRAVATRAFWIEHFWLVCEVVGLAGVMGGCVGMIGEWFLPSGGEYYSETILIDSAAIFAFGISRARLCEMVARLQGWDGVERRSTPR